MDIRPFGCLVAVSVFLSSIGPARLARADGTSDAQIAAARDLFLAAERDEDAERWDDALEKLRRVSAVKPTSGVRYHTALCEEHLGHLVAALRDYKAAANQARAENAADVLKLVDKRVIDASGRVPTLVVVVPNVPDATVFVDGEVILVNTPVALDPGPHTVEARAPGRSSSTAPISVQERDAASIEVKLDPVASSPAPLPGLESAARSERPSTGRSTASRDRAIAIVATIGAIGLLLSGIGAYAVAGSEHSDAVVACAQIVTPRTDACDDGRDSVRRWDWTAVGAWAGAVTAGTIAVVSFAKMGRQAATSAQLVVRPGSLAVSGSF